MDKEQLYEIIANLDVALKMLKKEYNDTWHTLREHHEIMSAMGEIEKFKFYLIKKYKL